jgi:hypothetical protein
MIDQTRPGMRERARLGMQRAGDWVTANRSHWLRGLLMLGFFLVLWVARLVVAVAAIFQFGALLLTGAPNAQVARFGAALAFYTAEIVAYLTCASEQLPFPFGPWPRAESRNPWE